MQTNSIFEEAIEADESAVVTISEASDKSASDTADKGFSMFGNSGEVATENEVESSGSISKIASTVGLLLVGALFGLGAYYFFLVPPKCQPSFKNYIRTSLG